MEAGLESRLISQDRMLLTGNIWLQPHGCMLVHVAGVFQLHRGIYVGANGDPNQRKGC